MLAVDMPYDLYWNGEPEALEHYIKSIKYRNMLRNRDFHLQGVYFLKALQDVLQFKNPQEIYPKQPFDLEKQEQGETQESIEKDIKAMFASIKRKENADG